MTGKEPATDQTKQKHTNKAKTSNKKPQTPKTKNRKSQLEWNVQWRQRDVMTRQLVCPVLSRSSLKHQHQAKTKQDDREVPSKKVVVPKPGIPPARIPEIASRSRAGMTSTDAHRSPRYAELCEKRGGETKVKRK